MTGLDAAIREAIDRAGADDPAARERVYRTARLALEKGLARRPDLDPAAADQQRRRFDDLIREIEAENTQETAAAAERPAPVETEPAAPPEAVPPPADEAPPAPAEAAAPMPAATQGWEPPPPAYDQSLDAGDDGPVFSGPASTVEPPGRPSYDGAPSAEMFDSLAREVRAEQRPSKRERRKAAAKERKLSRSERRARRPRTAARLLSALFLVVSLLVFGGLVLWFLSATGLLSETGAVGGGANSFRKFDAVSSGATANLMTQDGFGRAWSPIFVPGKGDPVSAGPKARIEAVADERGKALRLTSTVPGPDGDLAIEVPASLMDRMAGTTSVLALNLRAVHGKPTQIAVECDFSSLGGCSRRRFDVTAEMTDVVMKLRFEKGSPPKAPGRILLNTDIAGKGRSVDLFAVGLRGAD